MYLLVCKLSLSSYPHPHPRPRINNHQQSLHLFPMQQLDSVRNKPLALDRLYSTPTQCPSKSHPPVYTVQLLSGHGGRFAPAPPIAVCTSISRHTPLPYIVGYRSVAIALHDPRKFTPHPDVRALTPSHAHTLTPLKTLTGYRCVRAWRALCAAPPDSGPYSCRLCQSILPHCSLPSLRATGTHVVASGRRSGPGTGE
jgi:hypothetical protein